MVLWSAQFVLRGFIFIIDTYEFVKPRIHLRWGKLCIERSSLTVTQYASVYGQFRCTNTATNRLGSPHDTFPIDTFFFLKEMPILV